MKIALQIFRYHWVFFLFPNGKKAHLAWTHPQAALCDLSVARVGKGSATLPTKVPHHGTFWSRPSQIPSVHRDKHRVRNRGLDVPQRALWWAAPWWHVSWSVKSEENKNKNRQQPKKERKGNKTAWQHHNPTSDSHKIISLNFCFVLLCFSFYHMDIMDNKGFWFIINFINYIFWYESRT